MPALSSLARTAKAKLTLRLDTASQLTTPDVVNGLDIDAVTKGIDAGDKTFVLRGKEITAPKKTFSRRVLEKQTRNIDCYDCEYCIRQEDALLLGNPQSGISRL